MKEFVYGLVRYGEYEGTQYDFIKIREHEKDKFKQYCLDSQLIHGSNGESIELILWAYDIENVNNDYDVGVLTIQERQERVKYDLNLLDKMGDRHYLKGKRDLFIKLLEYEWE